MQISVELKHSSSINDLMLSMLMFCLPAPLNVLAVRNNKGSRLLASARMFSASLGHKASRMYAEDAGSVEEQLEDDEDGDDRDAFLIRRPGLNVAWHLG